MCDNLKEFTCINHFFIGRTWADWYMTWKMRPSSSLLSPQPACRICLGYLMLLDCGQTMWLVSVPLSVTLTESNGSWPPASSTTWNFHTSRFNFFAVLRYRIYDWMWRGSLTQRVNMVDNEKLFLIPVNGTKSSTWQKPGSWIPRHLVPFDLLLCFIFH